MITELTASDGHKLDCWIEGATGDARGGVVILQEIFGITDQLKGVARHYADLGYNAAVPALFDRQEKGAVITFDNPMKGRDMMLASDIEATTRDIEAAVKALAEMGGKVAVIGFCWGGGLAIRAAQNLDIAASVAYYGTFLPKYFGSPLKAPVLGHFGKNDDHVPPEMLDAAKAQFPEMEVHMYDAGHAFANEARPSYVEEAAQLAHRRTAEFLKAHIG